MCKSKCDVWNKCDVCEEDLQKLKYKKLAEWITNGNFHKKKMNKIVKYDDKIIFFILQNIPIWAHTVNGWRQSFGLTGTNV